MQTLLKSLNTGSMTRQCGDRYVFQVFLVGNTNVFKLTSLILLNSIRHFLNYCDVKLNWLLKRLLSECCATFAIGGAI